MILMEWFTNSWGSQPRECPPRWPAVDFLGAGGFHRVRQNGYDDSAALDRDRALQNRQPVRPSLGTDLVRGFAHVELHGSCDMRFPETGADRLLEFPIMVDHTGDRNSAPVQRSPLAGRVCATERDSRNRAS